MMVNLDKFFVLELQERGFDVDYNKMVEIYRASRERPERPACKIRKQRNERENEMFYKSLGIEENVASGNEVKGIKSK
jgi:hypothetical protein